MQAAVSIFASDILSYIANTSQSNFALKRYFAKQLESI